MFFCFVVVVVVVVFVRVRFAHLLQLRKWHHRSPISKSNLEVIMGGKSLAVELSDKKRTSRRRFPDRKKRSTEEVVDVS